MDNIRKIRTGLITVDDVIQDCLKHQSDIESIAVVIQYKDRTLEAGNSEQYASDIALKALFLQQSAIEAAQR